MSSIQSYKDLKIWQKGISLVKLIYKSCESFPKEEVFGLTSQIKRSSISIPSNIAEGWGRNSTQSYSHFLKNSKRLFDGIRNTNYNSKRVRLCDRITI